MKVPGPGEWFKSQKGKPPELHLDESKLNDPVEKLIDQLGPEGAVAELEERLKTNPDDEEARRQLNLVRNRLQDLLTRVNKRIGH